MQKCPFHSPSWQPGSHISTAPDNRTSAPNMLKYHQVLFTWLSWFGGMVLFVSKTPTSPVPCWRLQGPPHLLAGSQEESLNLEASKLSAEICKCEMNRRGRIQWTWPLEILVAPQAHAMTCCVLPHVLLVLCPYCASWLSTSALTCVPMLCWKRGSVNDGEPHKAVKPTCGKHVLECGSADPWALQMYIAAKALLPRFLVSEPSQMIQATVLVAIDYFVKLGFLGLKLALLHPRK